MSEETTVEQTTTEPEDDGSGVARAVLLTEERTEGVETTIDAVAVDRVVSTPSQSDATVADILDATEQDDGVSDDTLSAVVYEELDESFRIPSEQSHRGERCRIKYRVRVTVADTGLGQSETFYRCFKNEDKAQEFATKLREYDSLTFIQETENPELEATWDGRYKNCPDNLAEIHAHEQLSPSELRAMGYTGLGILFVGLLFGGGAIGLTILSSSNVLVFLGIILFSSLSLILSGFGLFGVVSALFSQYSSEQFAETVSLGQRNDPSLASVEELKDEIAPSTATVHHGVDVEWQDETIVIQNEAADARWTVETNDGVITSNTAQKLLKEADLHRLEQGTANLQVQERTSRGDTPTPRLRSDDNEWYLIPPEQ